MRARSIALLCLCSFLTLTLPVSAQDIGQASQSTGHIHTSTDFYPDTIEGLRDLLQSFIAAIKNADLQERARLQKSFIIPDPKGWFTKVYGPEVGDKLAREYSSMSPDMYSYLDRSDMNWFSEFMITRTEFANEQMAKASGIHFFSRMKHPVPVYTAYLTDRENQQISVIIPLFVYVDHGFRAIFGDAWQEDRNRPRCGLERLLLYQYWVGGSIMRIKLLHPAPPVPLPNADTSGSTQTVIVLAQIACDGSVLATEYLSGPPNLFRAASDAVKKQLYRQTIVNGVPGEVLTTVSVVFGPGG